MSAQKLSMKIGNGAKCPEKGCEFCIDSRCHADSICSWHPNFQVVYPKLTRLHFDDAGQDILWWDIDEKGIVRNCNAQRSVWLGTAVTGILKRNEADASRAVLDIRPGDVLIIKCKWKNNKKITDFIHPIEKVEPAPVNE